MSASTITGAIVLIAAGALLLIFIVWRKRVPASLRRIRAYDRLNRDVGLSVESGKRLHISLGRGDLLTARNASAFAGLAMLRQIVERASVSDRPPVVTSGDSALTILSQDALRAGYSAAGAEEDFRVSAGRLTGLSPFAYAAGALPIARDEGVSTHIIIGDLGVESALIADAAERQGASLVAMSDGLSAQALLYAAAPDPLVGEELFAAGAYSGAGTSHEASLNAQDVLRWLIIMIMLAGAALTILGVNF